MIERQGGQLTLRFDPARLAGEVVQKKTGFAWELDLAAAPGVACGTTEPMSAEWPWTQQCKAMGRLRPLQPADVKSVRKTEAGLELDSLVAGARFRIALELGGAEEIIFRLLPLPGGSADLIAADLPGPILPRGGGEVQVLVTYRNQGRLFTGAPGAMETETPQAKALTMLEGRYRLRFFGVLGDRARIGAARAGYNAIIEENADAQIILRQAEDGKLSPSVGWLPSMGTLAYARTVRYRFESRPTVASLAKGFRRYAVEAGLFKSLREKIAEQPQIRNLVGATACFIGYQKSRLDYVGTFRRLRKMGHKRFYIFPTFHINLGFERMVGDPTIDIRDRSKDLQKLGGVLGSWIYLAGLPDRVELQRLATRNADGTFPLNWQIGDEVWRQTCMGIGCQELAGRRAELLQADVHHFDTTASNALMECYAPAHFQDRRGDRESRIRLFRQVAAAGRLSVSEGIKDWAVPHYLMGSNKEVPVVAESPAFRVVPLQHLVYHDAVFSLWWEGDCYDVPHFHGGNLVGQSLTDILYGDMPLIFPVGRQYRWVKGGERWQAENFEQSLALPQCAAAARRAVEVARHFGRLALEEMTGFDWLGDGGRVQQTEFSGGTSVIANFGSEPWTCSHGRTLAPMDARVLR
jgi:hypothetical protein